MDKVTVQLDSVNGREEACPGACGSVDELGLTQHLCLLTSKLSGSFLLFQMKSQLTQTLNI